MTYNSKISVQVIKPRLLSLDALRGFDMFWIVGGGAFIQTLVKLFPASWLQSIATQMEHVQWAGFHFEDLIFPLFMFISGVTIPIAILQKLDKGTSKRELIIKIAKRMVILVLLGIIFNGALRNGFTNARYASVLGQIGISYFIASLIVIFNRSLKSQLYWLGGILVGYAAVQLLVPVPGIGAGVLTPEGCINSYIDRMFLPGRMGQGLFDALGLMCIISASAITLMGSVAGYILSLKETSELKKPGILSFVGTGLIILALCINPFYPIIKNCWTTTYNLFSGGISFLLLALFYLVIDVWMYKKWTLFFRVIGMNSILIYLIIVGGLVNVSSTSVSLFGWIARPLSEDGNHLIIVLGNIVLSWLLLYFMYRKKFFIRL